jgi:hypothetical protein
MEEITLTREITTKFLGGPPLVSYWFAGRTLDSHSCILLAPICFLKMLKDYPALDTK